MAALVRFQGGSADDPATRHGRSALLATLLTDGCGFASGTALDARLAELDARLKPLVSAREVGLLITAPMANTEAALDALLRCAVRPALTSRALEDARLKLIRSLWSRQEARLQAALGGLLAPLAPGAVAPWGTPQGVSTVHIGELRRLHSDLLKGTRMEVSVVADRAPEALARLVARRVAQLPPGKPAEGGALPSLAAETVRGELTEKGPLRVVVGLAAAGDEGSAAPAVFAEALARSVGERTGHVLWSWGDVARERSWVGVALALTEAELIELDEQVRIALRELSTTPEKSWRVALRRAQLQRGAAQSTARGYLEAAFARALGPTPSVERELELLRKLAQQPPAFFILRPAP
jgi:hypothetical protein